MDTSDAAAQALEIFKRRVESAERDVTSAEHSLRCFEAMCRANAMERE
jgi:hypothetical protein